MNLGTCRGRACVVIKTDRFWPRLFSSLGNGHSPVPLRSKSASCWGLEEWIKSFGLHYESHPGSSRRQSVLQCKPEPLPNQYWKKTTLPKSTSIPSSLSLFSPTPGYSAFLAELRNKPPAAHRSPPLHFFAVSNGFQTLQMNGHTLSGCPNTRNETSAERVWVSDVAATFLSLTLPAGQNVPRHSSAQAGEQKGIFHSEYLLKSLLILLNFHSLLSVPLCLLLNLSTSAIVCLPLSSKPRHDGLSLSPWLIWNWEQH